MRSFQTIVEEMAQRAIGKPSEVEDVDILRQAIIAELDAVSLYNQMARSTSNSKLKKVLLSVAREEKIHVGEFRKLLNSVDKDNDKAEQEGMDEAG